MQDDEEDTDEGCHKSGGGGGGGEEGVTRYRLYSGKDNHVDKAKERWKTRQDEYKNVHIGVEHTYSTTQLDEEKQRVMQEKLAKREGS